ncbi:MAG TPA: ComEC/Rec2 family competence protein, partial [Candidatus Limnocylindria bacterium]|nr:ComEC/Rec2 family competence protein [Candidatus Limnocylindria bacterium]
MLPAALAATLAAWAVLVGAAGVVLGALLALALAALSGASVGRRRLVWAAAAAGAGAVLAHHVVPVPFPWPAALELPRGALARPLALLVPAPESAILLGIVLGERGAIPPDLTRAFVSSGTSHLLAISGFNMTLVATAVALALRGRVGPAAQAGAAALAVIAYSVLVGLSPSVLRAALMATIAACAAATGRRGAALNALCAAIALMLAADPSAVDDVGLWLSALATAGLILWQEQLGDRLRPLPAVLRHGVATTLAATAPTLPLVAAVFGRVSLVSVAANLVCVPLFPLLMLAGAATSVAGALMLDLARPVALLAWAGALALRWAVELFASLPFASLSLPSGPLTGIALACAEIALVRAARSRRVRLQPIRSLRVRLRWPRPRVPALGGAITRRATALTLALALAPGAAVAVWPAPTPPVRITALDVGQGDAYLVEAGGVRALIDGGPDPDRLLAVLGATLAPWERRIDVVALTHAHTDHGAGLLAVLGRYEVGLALEPAGLDASPLSELWAAAVARNGAPRRAARAGERIELGSATIEVLAPDPDLRVDLPCLVLRITAGAFSVLLTGDAVDDALGRLLERPERLGARIYVPPHHGAATAHAVALRAAVRPEATLISVGSGNRYGHPTAGTLAALAGVPTYRTDQDGTVEIALDGTELVV